MSDTSPPAEPADASSTVEKGKAFKRKGFQIFGLGKQDFIRFFFGGNASLAVIVLILICVFLAKEAFFFFPQHHQGLKSYRLSGQEYVDYLGKEIKAHTSIFSSANIAYFAEVNRTSVEEDQLLRAYRAVLSNVTTMTAKTAARLKNRQKRLEAVEKEIQSASAAEQPDESKLAELNTQKTVLEQEAEGFRTALAAEVREALKSDKAWKMGVGGTKPPQGEKEAIAEAVAFEAFPGAKEQHPYIVKLTETSRDKKKAQADLLVDYNDTLNELKKSIIPLRTLHGELRKLATATRSQADSFETAAARREALLSGVEKSEDEAVRRSMTEQAEAIQLVEPDFAALNQPIYDSVPQHQELAATLLAGTRAAYAKLPSPSAVETKSARDNLKRAQVYLKRFEGAVASSTKAVPEWRHDQPLPAVRSITAFLFGLDWITASQWHDFYGLLPLFTGSLLISIIALTVAIPFSIAGAIYVNQLATPRELNFIKPAIEFIEAIPSVVLGFFGILVLGEALRATSQWEWLSWVPGFPMSERLTILSAGLLLAFMAVPTIFTLTEDALNNVPGAMAENSLAMGASRLQTIFRVIAPSAVSGLIAAVLLGFGRIIGETMVVLLVAGNKIKIPDITEGLGVLMQPAHTMTGIIAQELGEVDSGSLHWRALFMVGMVLFTISLLVNYSAQQVLKRYQKF